MLNLRKFAALSLLLVSLTAFASKPVPLPEAVMKAKTVFLSNHTGDQDVMDRVRAEFTSWDHFKIVDKKEDADIVATFEKFPRDYKGNTHDLVRILVTVPGADEPAFQAEGKPSGFTTWNLGGFAVKAVKEFEKRFPDDKKK